MPAHPTGRGRSGRGLCRRHQFWGVAALALLLGACGGGGGGGDVMPAPMMMPEEPKLVKPTLANITPGVSAVGEQEISPIVFTNSGGKPAANDTGCQPSINLPAGLRVGLSQDGASCRITGTPVAVQSDLSVVVSVTATNVEGSDSATVEITITAATRPPPRSGPPDLVDESMDQEYEVGMAISEYVFVNRGGGSLFADDARPSPGCQVSPSLPNGLGVGRSADGNSCAIRGRPAGPTRRGLYRVTAANASGSSTASIAILASAP